MSEPSERLPERKSEILAEGAKLKFVLNPNGELEILGNRKGLIIITWMSNFGARNLVQFRP